MPTIELNYGDRVRFYRGLMGISMRELGARVGTSDIHIGKIERGEIPTPKIDTMHRIAKALGVTVSHLTGEIPFQEAFNVARN